MPRRTLSRRTIGVLAAALLATSAAALPTHGPAATSPGVAQAASPLPPAPDGTLLSRLRVILPRLVLTRAEAKALDFDIQSNTFDREYPPDLSATFRWPLPGQTPNSPMMTEFFAGGFVLGKAENLQGRSRKGNVVVVLWAFNRPEGAYPQPARPARSVWSALDAELVRAGCRPALAARHRRQRSALGTRPRARARDLRRRDRRRVDDPSAPARRAGDRRQDQRRAIHRRLQGAAAAAPRPHDAGRPPRLAAHRRRRSPGQPRHAVVAGPRTARCRERLRDDPAAAQLGRRYRALGLLGGATQVISVAQIHGTYVTYAWAFPTARAARAALRTAVSQRGVQAGPRPRCAPRRVSSGPARACATTCTGCAASCCSRSAPTGRRASRCCSRARSSWLRSSTRTRPRWDELGFGARRRARCARLCSTRSRRRARAPDRPARPATRLAHRRHRLRTREPSPPRSAPAARR